MFLDDTPAFPMYSWQSLRFSGRVDREKFGEAYRRAMTRHPLMRSRVVQRGKKYFWETLSEPPEIIERTRGAEESARAVEADIRVGSGVRVFYDRIDRSGAVSETEIGFQVHHAASDATGIMVFIHDLFTEYAKLVGSLSPETPSPCYDVNSSAIRRDYGLTVGRYLRYFIQGFRSTVALVFHLPLSLLPTPEIDKQKPIGSYPRVDFFELTADETTRFRRCAKEHGMTVNDLLVYSLFLATCDFLDLYVPDASGWLRVAMPINMRTEKHRRMYAANMVSMVFLDFKKSFIADRRFLERLRRQIAWVKRNRQGLIFPTNLRGRRNLPGGIQMELSLKRCWSTTVLSNLGRIFEDVTLRRTPEGKIEIGDAVLESYSGSPPLRARTLTSWGAWTYAGRMTLSVRSDPRFLTEEQIVESLELFRKRILDVLAGPDYI